MNSDQPNLIDWHKSSYSYETGACVETGVWTKSSYSERNSNWCVEVLAQEPVSHPDRAHHTPVCVSMRDTEYRQLTRLDFPGLSFASLLGAIK